MKALVTSDADYVGNITTEALFEHSCRVLVLDSKDIECSS